MLRLIFGLIRACHPGPCAVVTAVAVLLGAGMGYPPGRLVLLGAIILTGQFSVGWSNDWLDAERDVAVRRFDKPVVRGDAPLSVVRAAAIAALGVSLALGGLLGAAAFAVHALTLVAAWAYNLGAKRTVLSPLPYLVAFGLLPAIVTLGLVTPVVPPWWLVTAGALLGLAAHVSNAMPDLDEDARTGVRGLPHVLGARRSGILTFTTLAASAVLLCLAPGFPPRPALVVAGVAGLALAAWGFVESLRVSSRQAISAVVTSPVVTSPVVTTGTTAPVRRAPTRLLMRLVMASALVDVAMLVLASL